MEFFEEIKEVIVEAVETMADYFCGKKHDKKTTQSKQANQKRNTAVSGADMVKRLKILMSIPVNTEKYPGEWNDFLDQIWREKISVSETEGRRNEFALYRGRLDLLKQCANEKNGVRMKIILEELLNSLDEDKKECRDSLCK